MLSLDLLEEIVHGPWFGSLNRPYLVVDSDLRIRAANVAYERATGHPESTIIGERLFDVFPDNPADPEADGVARLSASLETVFSTRGRHWMGVQKYDVRDLLEPGRYLPRVWVPVNTPIKQYGRVEAILHHVEDVTSLFDGGSRAVAWDELDASARALSRLFPDLPHDAVVGVVAHAYRTVIDVVGRVSREKAVELATVRLEVLAGHPVEEEPD